MSYSEIRDKLLSLVEAEKKSRIVQELIKIGKPKRMPLQEFTDLIGEITRKNSQFFMEKLYPKIQRLLRKYISKMHNPVKKSERQKYAENLGNANEHILKNYCFLEGEEIVKCIGASTYISHRKSSETEIMGILYITNYRIINIGVIYEKSSVSFGLIDALITVAAHSISGSRKKTFIDTITKVFSKQF
ncbi:MAG: hypothetical protein ACFFCI_24915, partial [Promethearchaeota archaeon]